jgi:hypothetical protein
MKTVDAIFAAWIEFMNNNGPKGGGLNSTEFRDLRERMSKELEQTFEDDENFFMGGGMS